MEPEYVTISSDESIAFVSLQENNAFAIIDLTGSTPSISSIIGAGIKDWETDNLSIDTTDKDDGVNFGSASFKGLNMPDGLDSFIAADGNIYLLAANEGDGREYEYTDTNGNDVISYTDESRADDFGLTIGGGDRLK